MLPTNNNTLERITANANEYGIAPGPLEILRKEKTIAEETIEVTGLYISWLPNSYCQLTSSCADEIRSRTGQCARVGRSSSCLCGHPLSNHEEVNYNRNSKSLSYIKPPKCSRCSCKVFNYCPSRPEEVGQYWLPRRKDFDIKIWRQVSIETVSNSYNLCKRIPFL